jgi:hypothetical protein
MFAGTKSKLFGIDEDVGFYAVFFATLARMLLLRKLTHWYHHNHQDGVATEPARVDLWDMEGGFVGYCCRSLGYRHHLSWCCLSHDELMRFLNCVALVVVVVGAYESVLDLLFWMAWMMMMMLMMMQSKMGMILTHCIELELRLSLVRERHLLVAPVVDKGNTIPRRHQLLW